MGYDDDPVEIISPSKELFGIFREVSGKIKKVLPSSKVDLIGSLAIPMKGKKEMDILVETNDVEKDREALTKIGFSIGPMVEGEAFSRNRKYPILIELHIVPPKHKKIKMYKSLIKKLKENPSLVKEYEDFKIQLEGKLLPEYRKEKRKFLKTKGLL